jgi:hypothetical protein
LGEDLLDVAQQLFHPPPLRPLPPIAAAPTLRESVMVDDATQFASVKPEPVGIRGWLAVLAFAQVVAILRLIGSLAQYYTTLDANFWTTFPTAIWGEALLNAAVVLLGVYTTVLLFRRSRNFPRFFILQLIGVICLPLVDLLWIASMVSLATGQPFSDYLTIEPKEGVQMIAGAIGALIWLTYILKSRRVANSFTR